MKHLRIETSLRVTSKVCEVFEDQRFLRDALVMTASNVWETEKVDEETEKWIDEVDDEYQTERLQELQDEIEDAFNRAGIDMEELEITII